MKFKFKTCIGWEDDDKPEVRDQATAEKYVDYLLKRFNKEEIARYGDSAALREVEEVVFLGGGSTKQEGGDHNWEKRSLVTEVGGYDRMECKACGCEGRRYGLGQHGIVRKGKWNKKKYDTCPATIIKKRSKRTPRSLFNK